VKEMRDRSNETRSHFESHKLDRRSVVGSVVGVVAALNYDALGFAGTKYVRPEFFGAKGDGNTDDTVALNESLSRSKVVSLTPNARYLITSSLALPAGASLIGNGNSTIYCATSAPAILLAGTSDVLLRGFTIESDRNKFPASEHHGIFVDWRSRGGQRVSIRNIIISNFAGDGIIALASQATPSRTLNVLGCNVSEVGGHGIIAQDYISSVCISGCHVSATGLMIVDRPGITASRHGTDITISNNVVTGSSHALGRSVHGISLDICERAKAVNNVSAGWMGYGIEIGGVTGGSVADNIISNCDYGIGGSGVEKVFRNTDVVIERNTVARCGVGTYFSITGATGLYLHRCIQFTDNIIDGTNAAGSELGFFLEYINGLAIRGGSVENLTKSGIYLLDCDDIDVQHLTIDRTNSSKTMGHAGLVLIWKRIRGVFHYSIQRVKFSNNGLQDKLVTQLPDSP